MRRFAQDRLLVLQPLDGIAAPLRYDTLVLRSELLLARVVAREVQLGTDVSAVPDMVSDMVPDFGKHMFGWVRSGLPRSRARQPRLTLPTAWPCGLNTGSLVHMSHASMLSSPHTPVLSVPAICLCQPA